MGLNGFSENSLREYLLAILGEMDVSEEILRYCPEIAKEVNDFKLNRRRQDDIVTHENLLALVMVGFFNRGKLQATRDVCKIFKTKVESGDL